MKDRIPFTPLSTQALRIGYRTGKKELVLFDGLDLSLTSGKMICFMGPNGVGKSSLIRTLAGLQKQLSGEVIVHTEQKERARQIAVVLTDKIVSANMTVNDVVTFGRYPYMNWNISLGASDREVIDRAIRTVHLSHLENEKIYSLSDGQLQMVMIARALAQDTPIMLLDEPTAHLDLNNRVEIMKLLKSLAENTNKAIFVSTHDLDLALQMADRIWLTGTEKNILTGFPEDLVLNGAFDDVFQFKGFDLKTGRVAHAVVRDVSVTVNGEGYEYLWTRNALQRNGFAVSHEPGALRVDLIKDGHHTKWKVTTAGYQQVFSTLEDLVNSI